MCAMLFVIDCWAAYVFRSSAWHIELVFMLLALFLAWLTYQVFDLIDHLVCKNTGNASPSFLRKFIMRHE
ncbi:MAG TPA: hypothetical protein VIR98_02795 [Candidatus Paceibacterota bacterium]